MGNLWAYIDNMGFSLAMFGNLRLRLKSRQLIFISRTLSAPKKLLSLHFLRLKNGPKDHYSVLSRHPEECRFVTSCVIWVGVYNKHPRETSRDIFT